MLGVAMFYGKGAGKLPTASAVVGDIIDAAKMPENDASFPVFETAMASDIAQFESYSCRNLLILPRKTEGKVLGIGGDRTIMGDKLVLITEALSEKIMKQIVNELGDDLISRIRIL
jgi:homoserine dehydrogenase